MKILYAFVSILLAASLAACHSNGEITTTEEIKYYYSMSTFEDGPIEIAVPNHGGEMQSIHVAYYYVVDDDTTLYFAARHYYQNTYIEGYFTITYKDDNSFTVKLVDDRYLEKLFGD